MAGVTIEELGLRFVQICMENYWSGCLLPVFFLAGVLWDIFTAGEKNPECSCIIWSFWHLRYIIRFL